MKSVSQLVKWNESMTFIYPIDWTINEFIIAFSVQPYIYDRFILIQMSQNETALNEWMHQHYWWAHQQARTGGHKTLLNPVDIIESSA